MGIQISKIENQLKQQWIFSLMLGIICGLFALSSFSNNETTHVIRTKGIIITESLEHERIFTGAPVPYAKNRIHTDLERVQQEWGKQMSPKYMNWYKNYDNSANSILFLDEKGFDRIAIGDSTPDPNIDKRIGLETGILSMMTMALNDRGMDY